ncbi:hypothetical protein ADEAN_000323400 [Angomonas deanei]|uniref:Uncharacterized protein n=1 Tax=Angomonas deanei TaxID=59799 RepID=A0A7G2C7Q4_9TRYP|nr:hypothetical protein ADEAN_000323400 [Angomonas deanei]
MDPFTDGTPPFRGTCRVLLEAILSQSLNVIVATYYLTGGETSTNQNNTTSNPSGMDTTTVYRVDHLLSSRVENHRNPSHTLSSFFRDDETPVHSTAPPAGGPLLTSLYSSSEEARATLATSHQYSLLTAIHLLRCPCATRILQSICQHSSHNSRSAILAEQVQSLFQRHPTWPPDAAVYLYRYTYNRFADATTTYNRASDRVEHSVRHNEALLSLLKTAINTEAYVTYPGAGASPLDKGRKRYTRTVTVTPLLLQVFPEVEPNHQASQSGDRWPVDYNCPHCWHRHTLLQYVLDSVLEEHAVVFADRSLLEKSFRQWRERYGWRVIHKIKGLVLDGEQGGGAVRQWECGKSSPFPAPLPGGDLCPSA